MGDGTTMPLEALLIATLSHDNNTRRQAEDALKARRAAPASEQRVNHIEYIRSCLSHSCRVLVQTAASEKTNA